MSWCGRWLQAGLTLALLLGSGAGAAQSPPPAEVFFSAPDLGDARLSPSGAWLAVSVGMPSGRLGLAVFDVAGVKPPHVLVNFGDIDVHSFYWVNDDRLVFDVAELDRAGGDWRYNPGLFAVHRDGSDMRQLVQMRRNFISTAARPFDRTLDPAHGLLHVPSGGGDEVVVGEYRFSRWGEVEALVPKRLNIISGQVSSLARGTPARATGWIFDKQGRPRVAITRGEGRTQVHWHEEPASEDPASWRRLVDADSLALPWTPQFVDASGRLYVRVAEGSNGEAVLKRFDFTAGQPEAQALVATPGFDFNGSVVTESDGDRVLGVRALTDGETTVWLDERMKAMQDEIDRRLPGRTNRLACRRCDAPDATVLISSWSDREPGQMLVWRGPPKAPTLFRVVGRVRKSVDSRQMATLDFERFAARDGRGIPVWVTTPAAGRGARTRGPLGARRFLGLARDATVPGLAWLRGHRA